VNDQLPAGNDVTPGTPLSVANVVIAPDAPDPNVRVVVCCAAPVALGESCLYVGEPNAELVLLDRFI